MDHVLFIQSLLEGHLGCFHFSATVNSGAMNIPVQIFVCTPVSNSFGSSNTFWSLFFPCWSAVPLLVDTEFPHVCGSLSVLLMLFPWSNNPSWHQPYTVRVSCYVLISGQARALLSPPCIAKTVLVTLGPLLFHSDVLLKSKLLHRV